MAAGQELLLHTLNEDVLILIFELLRPGRGLRSLSITCKSLRRACIPSLFTKCVINVDMPMVPGRLLPPELRSHCKSLSLVDKCPDLSNMIDTHQRLRYTNDRLLCGVMDGRVLRTVLLAMPLLRSILVSFSCNAVHGLRWEILTSILSVPQLENFSLQLFNFSPRPRSPTDVAELSLAPLKSFRYVQPAYRWVPHYFPPERDALADVLGQLQDSLAILHLPSMSAPIKALSVGSWPRLRELVLQGQLPEGLSSTFITLLSNMPKLRVLCLMFALPPGVDRLPVWPRGLETPFPWPELEELVLSFPTPDDQIYDFLPQSLHRLSLRCCPHHCIRERVDRPVWHSPILSASEMLQILSRTPLPHLDHLQLEYLADDADASLLRYLTAAFPGLLTLEVHRFRPEGVDDIPVAAIGEELGSLTRLHTLSLHLDPPDYPICCPDLRRIGTLQVVLTYAQIDAAERMLQSQADILAPLLSRSVRLLRLVEWDTDGGLWRTYRISRADRDDADNGARAQYDDACPTKYISPDFFVDLLRL